jgi:soluble lytic murein transglycosylase
MPDAGQSGSSGGGKTELSDEQLAWKRAPRCAPATGRCCVRRSIPMSVAARQDAAWSYWYGRALAAEGNTEGARAYFLRVSGQPHFYGLLAAEGAWRSGADAPSSRAERGRSRPGGGEPGV